MPSRRRDLILAFLFLLAAWQTAAWLFRSSHPAGATAPCWRRSGRQADNRRADRAFPGQPVAVTAGMLLAVSLAAPLGLRRTIEAAEQPAFAGHLPALSRPQSGVRPHHPAVLWIGDASKIVIIFVILFFQILVLVRDQAAGLRPELIQSVRSLGAGRRALFWFVYLPASLPGILTALRQSIGTAVAVLYIAEWLPPRAGWGITSTIRAAPCSITPRCTPAWWQ